MPRDAAALAVEAEMPAAWGQHRLDHGQARPIDRGVTFSRNPRVVERMQDKRRPQYAGKEMLGGIAFVIIKCDPFTV
jgi:hypothetical protein